VSERPDLILAAFLVLAAVAAAALVGALAEIGLQGVTGVAAVGAGLVSACILLAAELRQLPPELVVVAAITGASTAAFAAALRSAWREQRLIRALPTVRLDESDYAHALPPLAAERLHVLSSHRPMAFCAGLLRPRVVLTSALLDTLAEDERLAVVTHELSHARDRGPLKLACLRLLVRAFFWVPLLRDLVDRYVLLSELAADRAAITATSSSALAGALAEVLPAPAFGGSVGLADHAAARVDRLFDPTAPLPRLLTRARTIATAIGLLFVGALAYSPPRLSNGENGHLHTMTVNLLAHHFQARLAGFALTAATVTLVFGAARHLSARQRRSHTPRTITTTSW
jgi:Zn-dependent protease with chaperone function